MDTGCDAVNFWLAFIDRQPGDLVVKADGLCAGKGVVVTSSHGEARAAARAMLGDRQFGAAGARVVIEERLSGREVSMMALCDGTRFVLLASAEDHKAVRDGDQGPNTGGMGAYSPSPLVDDALSARIAEIVQTQRGLLPYIGYRVRTLHGLAHDIVRERPSLVGLAEDLQNPMSAFS